MNIISRFGIYLGEPIEGQEDGYKLRRAPVTYTEQDKALIGLHEYAQSTPGGLFILIDEQNTILVKGAKWEDEKFIYATDAEGMDVAFMFEEHNHGHNSGGEV
jgi:hypothetical protein